MGRLLFRPGQEEEAKSKTEFKEQYLFGRKMRLVMIVEDRAR